MRYISFFAGIGGLDRGLDMAGYECAAQIEIDPFCNQVLEKHWPGVPRYGDITQIHGRDLPYADLFAGGFPCQDLSQAGKRTGIEGSRSGLWFEFARLIGEARPRYVLVENVPGLLVYDGMRRVIGELSRFGYVGIWRCLRASEFGTSHLRKRVFIIAVNLAHSQYQRFSIGSETHHYNGNHASRYDPNGCDPHVADTHGGQREQLRRSEQDQGNVFGPDGGSESLDNSPGPRWDGRTENRGAAGTGEGDEWRRELQPEYGCGDLADTGNGLLPQPRRESQRRDGAGSAGEESSLAHAGCLNGQVAADLRRRPDAEPRQTDRLAESGELLGMQFAPGPSDPRWPYILAVRPDLAPALESTLRQLANGLSSDLDRAMSNRTKRLARLGNAVVPQVAQWLGERLLEFDRQRS